ncbi:hypothetical protein WU83_30720 [Mycobacterium nebraskense]|nr:hypothetical protein WU83_30720 [Mycobacterium nebraskense]
MYCGAWGACVCGTWTGIGTGSSGTWIHWVVIGTVVLVVVVVDGGGGVSVVVVGDGGGVVMAVVVGV